MNTITASKSRQGAPSALLLAGAVGVLALPSAVLGFTSRLDIPPETNAEGQSLVPGSGSGSATRKLDPRLAQAIAARAAGGGPMFGFTPAGLLTRPDRSVTVAVRVDAETARVITVRGSLAALGPVSASGGAGTAGAGGQPITPTAYNLGVAHGYQGFAQASAGNTAGLGLGNEVRHVEMPDLSSFQSGDAPGAPARLAPHISLDERERAGRAPRTLESVGTQTVDLGGSYRVSRNIDVTAGLRYQRDRDRLQPVIEGKNDSQAVFVGTQFRF